MPAMMPPSLNWLRTSCTTTPAVRPTARIASAENIMATEPPMSRPMKVFTSETLICVSAAWKIAEPSSGAPAASTNPSSPAMVSMYEANKATAAKKTASAVKKVQSSQEKTTLGDLGGLAALKKEMEKGEK